jgi:hypothetical protein
MKNILIFFMIIMSPNLLSQTKTESQLLKLSSDKFEWQLNKNWDALSEMMDENIILQHGNGNIQSKEEYFKTLRNGFLEYNNIDVTERSIKIYGNTAIIIGKVKFNISINKEKRDFNFRFTEVYSYDKGKWKMILLAFRENA